MGAQVKANLGFAGSIPISEPFLSPPSWANPTNISTLDDRQTKKHTNYTLINIGLIDYSNLYRSTDTICLNI